MSAITLGGLAQAHLLRRGAAGLKAEAQRLGTELATGRQADAARALGGDLAPLAAIEGSLARAKAYATVTAEAGLMLAGVQQVLERVDAAASDLAPSLLRAANTAQAALVEAAGAEAASRLDAAVAALNTRLVDRTLMAGTATDGPALIAGPALLDAVAAAAAGATTAAEVAARVDAWFADPAGFGAAWLGSGGPVRLPVSPEDTVSLDVTAADPALRDTLRGLALGALLDRGLPAGAPVERLELARLAGEALVGAGTARAELAARVGTAEGRVEAARQRNGAEAAALEMTRATLLAADPYDTATRFEAAQSQLETLHAVTARLARLSLVDFLR